MNSIEKSSFAIKQSSNYSILLKSDFRESYNEFLLYLDLLCELKLKTEKELISSIHAVEKLDSIADLNNMIDTSYDELFDVSQISHRILLSKIKHNVKSGIDKKLSSYNSAQTVYKTVEASILKGLKIISDLHNDEMTEYINTKFNLCTLSTILIPKIKLKETDGNFVENIINDYSTLIGKYNSKDKIESNSSNSTYALSVDIDDNDEDIGIIILNIGEDKIAAVKKIQEILGVDLKTAKNLADSEFIAGYPILKMKELRESLLDLGVDLE